MIVSGASGFIGKHCLKHLLHAGFEVEALYFREKPELASLENWTHVRFHRLNLLDKEAVQAFFQKTRASHFLHLAWYAEPGKFWQSELNKEWLECSLHLLKEFAGSGGKRFVGAGTCAEYDWTEQIMHEDRTRLHAASCYGRCKAQMFLAGSAMAKEAGIQFAWGRIFWLFGPGEDPRRVVPYVINSILDGTEAKCSSGKQERDYIFVDDLARAFALLVDADFEGAINLASGKAIAVRDLLESVACALGRAELLKLGAIETGEEEPLVVADIGRLRRELGFTCSYDLESALEACIMFWKDLKKPIS